ncbi:hypothetical protein KIW84_010874 [Lathyrus oleraceus]|uniref:Uncharacterized protein n=1 Tax=Pisum sativum TaxID=3888 RepID=A0A9D4YL71_PEA|nr:hypothetical protein KIW84_010874 [Pisum sativum]
MAAQVMFMASLGIEVISFELDEKFRWPKSPPSNALCKMCIEQLQLLLANAQKGGVHALAAAPNHDIVFFAGSDGKVVLYKLSSSTMKKKGPVDNNFHMSNGMPTTLNSQPQPDSFRASGVKRPASFAFASISSSEPSTTPLPPPTGNLHTVFNHGQTSARTKLY